MTRAEPKRPQERVDRKLEFVRASVRKANKILNISDDTLANLAQISISPSTLNRFRNFSPKEKERGGQTLDHDRLERLNQFFTTTLLGRAIIDAPAGIDEGTSVFNRIIERVLVRSLGETGPDFTGVFVAVNRSSSFPGTFLVRAFHFTRETDGACVFENYIQDATHGDDRNIGAILFGDPRPQLVSINLESPDHFRLFSPFQINVRDDAVQVMAGPLVGRNRRGLSVEKLQYLVRYKPTGAAAISTHEAAYAQLKARTGRFALNELDDDFRAICLTLVEIEYAEASRKLRDLTSLRDEMVPAPTSPTSNINGQKVV